LPNISASLKPGFGSKRASANYRASSWGIMSVSDSMT
jgi:hypothetical protein